MHLFSAETTIKEACVASLLVLRMFPPDRKFCHLGVCKHDATCVDAGGRYTCFCSHAFKGINCSGENQVRKRLNIEKYKVNYNLPHIHLNYHHRSLACRSDWAIIPHKQSRSQTQWNVSTACRSPLLHRPI